MISLASSSLNTGRSQTSHFYLGAKPGVVIAFYFLTKGRLKLVDFLEQGTLLGSSLQGSQQWRFGMVDPPLVGIQRETPVYG